MDLSRTSHPAIGELSRPRVWAALPVKPLAQAKQRLSPQLPPALRAALAAAMLEDVLDALALARSIDGVLVVTTDGAVAAIALRRGATVIGHGAESMDAAARAAGGHLRQMGVDTVLLLHSDLPGLAPEEIDGMVASHLSLWKTTQRSGCLTIAPSHDMDGSNAMAISPPDALPTAYGAGSFGRHLAIARSLGLEVQVTHGPGLARDLDHPADVAPLLEQSLQGSRSRPLLTRAAGLLAALPDKPTVSRA